MTLGKGIGSGFAPLGAVVIGERIREAFRRGTGRFVHGFTYSGAPSAVFVGIQVHAIMAREELFTRAARIGAYLEMGLRKLAEQHESIGDIRGRGLLWGLEFVADRKTRRPFTEQQQFTRRLVGHMRDNNVLVAAGLPHMNFGKDGDHIQISPPFVISESEVNALVTALDETLNEVSTQL